MGVWFSSCMKPKKTKQKMQFVDMDDDCLMQVLEQLSPANLMKMAQASKRLNRLVEVKLRVKIKKVVVESTSKGMIKCRHRSFDSNEIVYFDSIFTRLQRKPNAKFYKGDLNKAPVKATFLRTLARFSGVKSINFGKQELTGEVLQEAAKLCPEVECLTVKICYVDENVWNNFFTQVGHQIVHFRWNVNEILTAPTLSIRIIEMMALMCPNIKQIDLSVFTLHEDLIDLLKRLPKSYFIGIKARYSTLSEPLINYCDTMNYLFTLTVDWSAFGTRNQRLTELKFSSIIYDYNTVGVEFLSLKQLVYDNWYLHNLMNDLNCLAASRFPALEVFELQNINNERTFTEDWYDRLFRVMSNLKELRIGYKIDLIESVFLPGPVVLQLKKLERIQVTIAQLGVEYWKLDHLVSRLNVYFDEISTLNRLVLNRYIQKNSFDKIKNRPLVEKWIPCVDELKMRCEDKRIEIVYNSYNY